MANRLLRQGLMSFALLAALLAGPMAGAGQAAAQTVPPASPQTAAPQAAPTPGLLKVYLDCYRCDEEYMRQNIAFVEYVRDRAVADVHVLVTTQQTGSGGLEWTLKVIGLSRFQGVDRTFTFTTPQAATSDDQRKEFGRVFKISVAAYTADTASARDLDVTFTPSTTSGVVKVDPWNAWVFRVNGNTFLNGEESTSFKNYRISMAANRVTANWKINFSASRSVSENRYEVSDGTINSRSESSDVSSLIVKSLGPKWSVGGRLGSSHSSFNNNDRSYTAAPGIEFDFFPYSEFNRRSLTLNYSVGVTRYRYRELTIFDKLEELVPTSSLNASLGLRQPWGSLNVYASHRVQLNDTQFYRSLLYGSTDVRLFKGFSFNLYAEYDNIHDQIGLPKQGATQEEILLRLQQLSTSYSYFISFGVSYSFGSIFNSVVNPRFNGLNIF
jgi:hypothetical protein